MGISRPRASILSLFDPLAAPKHPATPPRNESPTIDSDKENEGPSTNELTLTTFFNRTYKSKHTSPKPLTRRLIDVGDVTVDHSDNLWPVDEDDFNPAAWNDFEDDENDTLTFRQMAVAATPKWNTPKAASGHSQFTTPSNSRTPLAELSLGDPDATPIFRNKAYKNQASLGRSKLAQPDHPLHIVITEPESLPSSPSAGRDVEGVSVSSEHPSKSLSPTPGQLACSASSLNLSTMGLGAADESLFNETATPAFYSPSSSNELFLDASVSSNTARLRPPKTSSNDENRYSIDLQSSFQMQLGSDSTFDLLNDKISFFDSVRSGMEANTHDFGEGTFDLSFEEAQLARSVNLQQRSSAEIETSQNEAKEAPVTSKLSPSKDLPESQIPEEVLPSEDAAPIDEAIPPSLKSRVLKSGPTSPNPIQDAFNLVQAPRNSSPEEQILASTPPMIATPRNVRGKPTAPPPVAGLRIVKRSTLAMQKASAAPPSRKAEPVAKESKPKLPPSRRPSISPPQVPDSPATKAPSRQPRMSVSRSDASRPNPALATRRPLASDGPRRVLLDEQNSKPSTNTSRANPGRPASSTVIGPRRVPNTAAAAGPRNAAAPSTRQNPPSGSSSLPKPAARGSNTASSIPQPSRVSRLPAPSVVVRPTPAAGKDGARGLPIRRVI